MGRCPEGSPSPAWTCQVLRFKGPQGPKAREVGAASPTATCFSLLSPLPVSSATPRWGSCTLLLNPQAPTEAPAGP